MTATSITFIENPPYSVDFLQYVKKPKEEISFISRLNSAISQPFLLLEELFTAMAKAGYETLSYSGSSFKYIVLEYRNYDIKVLPRWRITYDLYLVAFKIAFWVAAMLLCFAVITARLLYQRMRDGNTDNTSFLSCFAGEEINVSHIVTHDPLIDVSEVPKEINVDCLLQMFDEINFTDSTQPGYMAPASRKEGDNTYSLEELKEGLQTFVNHVNQRVAFLGTPPVYDIPRLCAFYEHLENAVRFVIHKSNQDILAFRERNRENPEEYPNNVRQEWNNLLEDRARIPLNLAIAGKHCGARYMGEATELYCAVTQERLDAEGSLQDTLIKILAAKRKEIANAQIQRHLGNGVHGYNRYMSSLGKTLGIPGTANVVEHLASELDRNTYLEPFFEEYTVDCIIETVQEAVKNSQSLREKIIDWLKTQRNDWESNELLSLDEMIAAANAIIASGELDSNLPLYIDFQTLQRWIADLKERNVSLAFENGVEELLSLDRDYWKSKYPNLMERTAAKQRIKNLFSLENLGRELLEKIKEALAGNEGLGIESFTSRLLLLQKRSYLCRDMHLNSDTAMRVIQSEVDLRTALEDRRNQLLDSDFLSRLQLGEIAEQGLSPEMIEWVLVSQGILLPQVRE